MTSLKQIEEQARALSAEDRAKLAESLLESLQLPLSDIAYPAEDVFADARRLSRCHC